MFIKIKASLVKTAHQYVAILMSMGADFSELQGVLRFVLQILPADNLRGFKTHSKSRHQNIGNEESGTTVCSLTAATPKFQESS
jgi:hypothetical protein